jgi:ubiquitin carboxyl-terminal hydrolase 40
MGLNPNDHKLYRTDWLEDPVEHISKEKSSLQSQKVRNGNLIVVKDNASVVLAEFDRFQIFLSKTGVPDDILYVQDVTIKRNQPLGELKRMLL